MPTGEIIHARPETLKRIRAFKDVYDNDEEIKKIIEKLKRLEEKFPKDADKVFGHYKKPDKEGKHTHDEQELEFESETLPVRFKNAKFIDGILQDDDTGEMHYFFATVRGDPKSVIEGCKASYSPGYCGICEMVLKKTDQNGKTTNNGGRIVRYVEATSIRHPETDTELCVAPNPPSV